MAVAGRTDSHAGVTVEKNIAVHVFDPNAAGTFSDEFEGWPRVGWIHKFCVRFDDLFAVRTRQRRLDFGALWCCEYGGRHFQLPCQKAQKIVQTLKVWPQESEIRTQKG